MTNRQTPSLRDLLAADLWSQLSTAQRLEAYCLGTHSQMPSWMTRILAEAEVTELVGLRGN
jgi:hypothetical protein